MTETETPRAKIGLGALVAATYFMVAGGPYGLEELLQKTGFGVAIVVLIVTPLLWSLPTSLMVGELAAALPREGGYYAASKQRYGCGAKLKVEKGKPGEKGYTCVVVAVRDAGPHRRLVDLDCLRVPAPLGRVAHAAVALRDLQRRVRTAESV